MDNVELRKQIEREELIDARSGINPQSMDKGLDMMIQHLRYTYAQEAPNPQFKKIMTGNIAGLLRTRMSIEEADKILENFEPSTLKIFEHAVSTSKQMFKEKLGLDGAVGNGDSFWEVSDPTLPHEVYTDSVKLGDSEIGIQYKEYFTFVPTSNDPHELVREVSLFYSALIKAYEKVNNLAREKGINIAMKYHDNLKELLMDLDSAIIYVPDPETGQKVRELVGLEMSNAGVVLKRKGRAESGFDMKKDNRYISHRQLVAQAVAGTIDRDYRSERRIISYDKRQLAETILGRAEQASRLNPQEILQML